MQVADIEAQAQAGQPEYQVYLARLYLGGSGVTMDDEKAIYWLDQALAQNSPAALAERAGWKVNGYYGPPGEAAAAWADLLAAAAQGFAPAQRQVGVAAIMAGEYVQGLALLHTAADQGDPVAPVLLADLLLSDGDTHDAAFWFYESGENALADWRIEQHALPDIKEPKVDVRPVDPAIYDRLKSFNIFAKPQALREDKHPRPAIYVLRNAVPHILCSYVCALGGLMLERAQVVDGETGKIKIDPVRTAYHAQFATGTYDFIMAVFDEILAAHSATRRAQGEPVTMIVYKPGEEYKPHWDYLVDNMDEASGRLARSGNRIRTALVTLDDGFEGGATSFTRLNIDVKLGSGDVLVFDNVTAQGLRDDDSMHAGTPVTSGRKWLASKWIRERDYVR